MYRLGVTREFVAQHRLVGGDFGRENGWHSHHYRLEAVFEGEALDRHGFLVDIDRVGESLDGLIDRYRDRTLNDLPEFEGLNPSLEHFARILAERLAQSVDDPRIAGVRVVLWEDDVAWASWERPAR
jgi:6-pyruvoyltetrahydropterin/6-carboxytetrahydropterin synthase